LLHGTEDNYDYDMKKRALEKDTRINKTRFSNIDAAHKELENYEESRAIFLDYDTCEHSQRTDNSNY
jgi:hypothetical protein